MPADKLILMPADPQVGLEDCHELVSRLQDIGLIGERRTCGSGPFYPTGDRFLQLVSFLGCSPHIELDPPQDHACLDTAVTDGRFCHITVECGHGLRFRADAQTRPPRCSHCGQVEPEWQTCIDRWRDDPGATQWTCSGCGGFSSAQC